jgi:aminoglycoside phosphotransferase (APT) family kinase protein
VTLNDPNVTHLDLAWSLPDMCELFNSRVFPEIFPGEAVSRVKRRYTAYKAGKECLSLYELQSGDAEASASRLASVTFGPLARLEHMYAKPYYQENGNGHRKAGAPAVFLRDYPCLVEFFPSDWKLPALRRAAVAEGATTLLPTRWSPSESAAAVTVTRVKVLRYRPRRRCVLHFELDAPVAGGEAHLIAKVYPHGPRALQVRDKLRILRAQRPDDVLRFPATFDSTDETTLLMERVKGVNMGVLFESTKTEQEAKHFVSIAARALVRFHELTLESEERRTIPQEFEQLRERTRRLRNGAPELADRVDAVLDRIAPMCADAAGARLCLIHGDYKPTQLLVDGDRPALVDLDRACLGDPAIDVGNLMAVLHKATLLEGVAHAAALPEWFLAEYEALSGRRDIAQRARLFETLSLARMLVRKFERKPHKYFRDVETWRPFVLNDEIARGLRALRA